MAMTRTFPRLRAVAALAIGTLLLSVAACKPKPAEIRVTPKKSVVYGIGKKTNLTAEVLDAKGRSLPEAVVTWSISNKKVATVDEGTGALKSLAPGKAIATAAVGGSELTGTAAVEVIDVASATLTPTKTTLAGPKGTKFAFALDLKDTAGKAVKVPAKWVSTDPKVLTVDDTGTITSVAEGTTTITATIGDFGSSAEIRVTFREIATLDLSPATIPLKVGETGKATLVARDPAGQVIPDVAAVWVSSDPKVATVAVGQVLAASPGSATIRASCGGKSAEVSVIVY